MTSGHGMTPGWPGRRTAGLAALLVAGLAGAAERLDVATFDPPPGWTRQQGEQMIGFVRQATPDTYATLAIYAGRPGAGDAEAEFMTDWNELVLHDGAYRGERPTIDRRRVDGWTVAVGLAATTRPNGTAGKALLADFFGGGQVVSVVAQFNDDRYLDDVRRFVGSVHLPPLTAAAPGAPAALAAPGPAGTDDSAKGFRPRGPARWSGGPVAGIWVGLKAGSTFSYNSNHDAYEYGLVGGNALKWLTFLADGTMYEGLPPAGLWALDPVEAVRKATDGGARWGSWRITGSRVTAECRKGRRLAWTLEGGRLAEDRTLTGDTKFHRLASVDGLVLDGTWATSERWSDASAGSNWTGRPVIRFTRDGGFEDLGAFLSDFLPPLERNPREQWPGRGRYRVEGFTLMLRYADGREVHHVLTPPMNGDALKDPSRFFLRDRPFFRQ